MKRTGPLYRLFDTLMVALRSTLFQILSILSLTSFVPILLVGNLIPFKRRYVILFGYGRSVLWLTRHILGIRWEVEGFDRLPEPGGPPPGRLIVSKHQSTWETMFLPTELYLASFVLKKELLWVPIFGAGLKAIRPIAIDRKAGTQALKQILKQGKDALAEGRDVIIFPEGTRLPPDAEPDYKIGAAMLAVQAKVPVYPVAVDSGCLWRKGQFLKRPGTIHVVFGPPIESTGKRADALNAEIKAWIETEQQRMYREYGCAAMNDSRNASRDASGTTSTPD
ncbi:hypothetical protein A9404_10815 [Halothiobacillus diazotrophicus]|uniref:Phospholipid/glycerol acyltransferase domain-containing protein n=1 Tax=Halothiobacillus diazotrophicus TaxID=1860122 RepID=A0A191ZIY5_9GAMM|nr:lysophospholipid acyltransferase family protein [Halothiobacillus diazotrophicus]ANJ67803.1 hypothetical protein A9404_10815 [Halothiobacillus diazotrophicus]